MSFETQSPTGGETFEANPLAREFAFQKRQQPLADFLGEHCHNVSDPQLLKGAADFVRDAGYKLEKKPQRQEAAQTALELITDVDRLMSPEYLYKASTWRYLRGDWDDPAEHVRQFRENADWMVSTMGQEFFAREREFKRSQRKNIFRADIVSARDEPSDYAVTVKGGSGSGTFSLDFALVYNDQYESGRYDMPYHEIWRIGVDTELTQEDRAARIIRNGSALKKNDEIKWDELQRFKRDIGSPSRLLTFAVGYYLYQLGFDHMRALSDEGGRALSTLGISKTSFSYDHAHASLGLAPGHNPHWLDAPEMQNTFPTRVALAEPTTAIQQNEPAKVHLLLDAFSRLRDRNGNPFPLRPKEPTPDQIGREILAMYHIQGSHHL